MRSMTLKVEGMKCSGCTASVQSALEEVGGVHEVTVSLDDGEARLVVVDALEPSSLIAAIEAAGFHAA